METYELRHMGEVRGELPLERFTDKAAALTALEEARALAGTSSRWRHVRRPYLRTIPAKD